jgi:hypothetical protein
MLDASRPCQRLLLAQGQRQCCRCFKVRPLGQFVIDKRKAGGRAYLCASCKSKRIRERATDADRALRNEHERNRRATRPAYRDSLRENETRYAKANPRKGAAHVAVYQAIKQGKLTRLPCEACGAANSEAHHDDYAKKLDVRWLCPRHHRAWHAEHGEGANAQADLTGATTPRRECVGTPQNGDSCGK